MTPFYYPNLVGGSEVSVKLLAERLVAQGNQVIVLSFDLGTRGVKSSEIVNGVFVQRYKIIRNSALLLTLTPQVYRVLKKWENEVDIFHIYNVFPIAGGGIYKNFGGKKKVVVTLNNYAAFCPISGAQFNCKKCSVSKRFICLKNYKKNSLQSIFFSVVYPILTWLSKRSDVYIALSSTVKNLYVAHGFDSKSIVIIPNFFEEIPVPVNRQIQPDAEITVLFVGRLIKDKGVDILINAFSKIHTKKKVKLIIVGDGEEMMALKKLVNNLSLNDCIYFTGFIAGDKRFKYYLDADIFVHPAIWPEAFGRTLLEALHFEIPLIVSDVGAPSEIIGSAGLTFSCGSVDDLSEKIQLLVENDLLRQTISSESKKVLANYRQGPIILKILKLYQYLASDSS